MITPVIPPIVNMNGTSRDQLASQLMSAGDAIRTAQNAMQACMPHGRDYQNYNPPLLALDLARARHIEEMTKLAQVGEYLDALLVKVVAS